MGCVLQHALVCVLCVCAPVCALGGMHGCARTCARGCAWMRADCAAASTANADGTMRHAVACMFAACCCMLSVVCCCMLLYAVCCMLLHAVACRCMPLHAVACRCMLSVACCTLHACLLYAKCCLLHDVFCMGCAGRCNVARCTLRVRTVRRGLDADVMQSNDGIGEIVRLHLGRHCPPLCRIPSLPLCLAISIGLPWLCLARTEQRACLGCAREYPW
jgi:hypothetical protein